MADSENIMCIVFKKDNSISFPDVTMMIVKTPMDMDIAFLKAWDASETYFHTNHPHNLKSDGCSSSSSQLSSNKKHLNET